MRRLWSKSLPLVLGVILDISVGSPTHAVGLVQLYHASLINDAQYAAARATAEAGREKELQGLSGLLPTLSASANTLWNENNYELNRLANSRQNFNTNAYNVQLSQPIFNWQNISQYAQGKWLVIQAEANFAQASQDLILRVAQAYFDVLYAEEDLQAVQRNKQAISQQRAQAQKNFEVGTATITDAQEAQSRYDLASAQEIAALNDLEVKRYALSLIVGKNTGTLDRLKADAKLNPPQPATMESWVVAAENNNFAVQAQQAALEIASKEVEKQRAGHYPVLSAVANYGHNKGVSGITGNNLLNTESRNIGVQVTIPLIQGGYVSSKTREAIANRSAADAGLDSARRNATLTTQQSFLGVVNGLAQVLALEAALKSSESALESNKLGYEVGVRINIDVLNAEQQVYTTRRDLAKARFNTLLAQLRLKSAVGSLSERDIDDVARLFELR